MFGRPDMNARRIAPPALAAALLAAALAPGRADAQREGYTYLSYVQPDVSLISKAEDDSAARINMPVLAGDSLVTGVGSRAEAVLADGNVVRVDGFTDLRFERMARTYESDDDRDLLFLARGTVAVEVRDVTTRERALRLDTDDVTVLAPSRALFRVDAGRRGTEIYVLSGRVEVSGRGGRALVRAGEYAFVSGDSDVEVGGVRPRRATASRASSTSGATGPTAATRPATSPRTSATTTTTPRSTTAGIWTYSTTCGCTCWRPRVGRGLDALLARLLAVDAGGPHVGLVGAVGLAAVPLRHLGLRSRFWAGCGARGPSTRPRGSTGTTRPAGWAGARSGTTARGSLIPGTPASTSAAGAFPSTRTFAGASRSRRSIRAAGTTSRPGGSPCGWIRPATSCAGTA